MGFPGIILRCLEQLELKDCGKPVALLAKLVGYRPLAVQVGKGLLDPKKMERLLSCSSPKEIIIDILMIISDLARMDKVRFTLTMNINANFTENLYLTSSMGYSIHWFVH